MSRRSTSFSQTVFIESESEYASQSAAPVQVSHQRRGTFPLSRGPYSCGRGTFPLSRGRFSIEAANPPHQFKSRTIAEEHSPFSRPILMWARNIPPFSRHILNRGKSTTCAAQYPFSRHILNWTANPPIATGYWATAPSRRSLLRLR